MKILLIGEASFLHNTLKKGLLERGHRVLTMSDGNGWHDAPRFLVRQGLFLVRIFF